MFAHLKCRETWMNLWVGIINSYPLCVLSFWGGTRPYDEQGMDSRHSRITAYDFQRTGWSRNHRERLPNKSNNNNSECVWSGMANALVPCKSVPIAPSVYHTSVIRVWLPLQWSNFVSDWNSFHFGHKGATMAPLFPLLLVQHKNWLASLFTTMLRTRPAALDNENV